MPEPEWPRGAIPGSDPTLGVWAGRLRRPRAATQENPVQEAQSRSSNVTTRGRKAGRNAENNKKKTEKSYGANNMDIVEELENVSNDPLLEARAKDLEVFRLTNFHALPMDIDQLVYKNLSHLLLSDAHHPDDPNLPSAKHIYNNLVYGYQVYIAAGRFEPSATASEKEKAIYETIYMAAWGLLKPDATYAEGRDLLDLYDKLLVDKPIVKRHEDRFMVQLIQKYRQVKQTSLTRATTAIDPKGLLSAFLYLRDVFTKKKRTLLLDIIKLPREMHPGVPKSDDDAWEVLHLWAESCQSKANWLRIKKITPFDFEGPLAYQKEKEELLAMTRDGRIIPLPMADPVGFFLGLSKGIQHAAAKTDDEEDSKDKIDSTDDTKYPLATVVKQMGRVIDECRSAKHAAQKAEMVTKEYMEKSGNRPIAVATHAAAMLASAKTVESYRKVKQLYEMITRTVHELAEKVIGA